MLKGHVFKKQRFGNEIFALFIDTFLNKKCGIAENYKEKMKVTASGHTLTVASGCVCVRGRFIEEDTSTSISTGTDTAYCKLVVEIDLSKENTDDELLQLPLIHTLAQLAENLLEMPIALSVTPFATATFE